MDEDQPKPVGIDTSAYYFTDLEWEDRNDAKQWFINKGIEYKCALVLGRNSSKDRLEFVCERGGKQESHWAKDRKYVKKTTREYITKSKKYGCPFKIIVNRPKKEDGTKVYKFYKVMNGCHNHDDPESLVGHSAVCGLKPHQLETVRSMKACRPSDILRKIKEDDKDNLSTLRQIYTARAALRRSSWNGREVMEQSQWLADQHGYTMRKQVIEGKVTRIFLGHPEMIKLAQCFYQVLLIDCTYKTNKYNMPLLNIACHTSDKQTFTVAWGFMDRENGVSYTWMLETLKEIYRGDQTPRIIVTDKDEGLMNAIGVVFPDAKHFLCTWHIQCNIRTNCRGHIQRPKPQKGTAREKAEDERLQKLTPEQREKDKKKSQAEYEANGLKWKAFQHHWDIMVHSMSVGEFECHLESFIAMWKKDYEKCVVYCLKELLDPFKEKFVYAYTYQHMHYKNEATSIAEGSHGRLKSLLRGSQNTVVTIQEAIHEYTKADIIRITAQMEESRMKIITSFKECHRLIRHLNYRVSHWAILYMLKDYKYYVDKERGRKRIECKCMTMTAFGFPCRHMIATYKQGIPFEIIDSFWKQLTFKPPPMDIEELLEPFVETDIGKEIIEKFENKSALGRKVMLDDLRLAANPHMVPLGEPPVQPPTGRPPSNMTWQQERKLFKEAISTGRILCRHEKEDAKYEEAKVPKKRDRSNMGESGTSSAQAMTNVSNGPLLIENEEAPAKRKRGRPKKEESGTSAPSQHEDQIAPTQESQVPNNLVFPTQESQVPNNLVVPSQESQVSTTRVSRLRAWKEEARKKASMVTIRAALGDGITPRDERGRPHRTCYTIFDEYYSKLPDIIKPYVLSTDDVDSDGNCGYHVASEQLGHISLADDENLTQCQYIRKMMALRLQEDKDYYISMMKEGKTRAEKEVIFGKMVVRVQGPKGKRPITQSHWMQMPICGHLLAETWSCVVHLFGDEGSCYTFAPKYTIWDESLKDRRIVLFNHNNIHYIGLRVRDDCPLPPVYEVNEVSALTKEWLKKYDANMRRWKELIEPIKFEGLYVLE